MSGGPGVQYSPDGRWWWDGSQWRPVPSPTAPPPQLSGPVPGQVSQPGAPGYPAPRPGAGVPRALIAVLAICALLLLAGGVGLFLALRSVADRLSAAATPPMPAVSLPVSSPGTSLALPPIKGVTVSQVTAALKSRGYSCTDPRQIADTWVTVCSLTDDQSGLLYDVSLGGSDPNSVGLISAGLLSGSRAPTSAEASQFFRVVVGTVGHGSEASQATTWIQQNLGAGGDGSAGGLRLHLGRSGSNYLLVVTSS